MLSRILRPFLLRAEPLAVQALSCSKVLSKRIFICAGYRSTSGLRLPVHLRPPACPTHLHPAARRLAPFSLSRMYVTRRLYPIALAARQAAAYSILQAFRVPSVQSRFTSAVHPSSRWRDTGLPTITTPTIFSPSERPIENLCPVTGPWWRWFCSTKAFASLSVMGTISSIVYPSYGFRSSQPQVIPPFHSVVK